MSGIENPIINNVGNLPTTGFDEAAEQLRAFIDGGSLTWLQRSFGRCYRMPRDRTAGSIIVPKYYIGPGDNDHGEYADMTPNDAIKSMSFILGDDAATTPLTDLEPFAFVDRFSKAIRIIFFVNYQQIFDQDAIGGPYPFNEILIEQVVNVLAGFPGLLVTGYVSETITEVYEGFDLSEMEQRLLHYPFGAFRIEGTLSYNINCIP